MKKWICFVLTLILTFCLASAAVFAEEYTAFDLVFEEKAGENVNQTPIRVYASVGEEETLTDRTDEFTLEDVKWYQYLPEPETGKTADDYDYVDEELHIYGTLVTDDVVFEPDTYAYFLMISRLYAQEDDTFYRNVRINGTDVDEMNGICYNTGNEFFIKTVTNGSGGASDEETTNETVDSAERSDTIGIDTPTDKCKICGICPVQPLGICLFIWIAAILILLIVVVLLISHGKKNKKKN